jgi:hypothetical protein
MYIVDNIGTLPSASSPAPRAASPPFGNDLVRGFPVYWEDAEIQ